MNVNKCFWQFICGAIFSNYYDYSEVWFQRRGKKKIAGDKLNGKWLGLAANENIDIGHDM